MGHGAGVCLVAAVGAWVLAACVAPTAGDVVVKPCLYSSIHKWIELNDVGESVGNPTAFRIDLEPQHFYSNTQSTSASASGRLVAFGINGHELDNRVAVVNLTGLWEGGQAWDAKDCAAPDGANVDCVVFLDERLYVVYSTTTFTNGMVAALDPATCEFTDVAPSPARVKGSLGGPGGQCVSLPSLGKLYWLVYNQNQIVAFDVAHGTAETAATVQLDTFVDTFADDTNQLAYYVSQSDVAFAINGSSLEMRQIGSNVNVEHFAWMDITTRVDNNPTVLGYSTSGFINRVTLSGVATTYENPYFLGCNAYSPMMVFGLDLPPPSPTASPSNTPTISLTPSVTPTVSFSSSVTPTISFTSTVSVTPTASPTISATASTSGQDQGGGGGGGGNGVVVGVGVAVAVVVVGGGLAGLWWCRQQRPERVAVAVH